jgi:hypothetical protein
MNVLRRIGRDLRERRHIEVYAVALVSTCLAFLSLVGDLVSDDVRWAVVLAALGLLTYQVALPSRSTDLDDVLHSRASFDDITFGSRLTRANEVWIFGPSAVSVLSADSANHLRTKVLSRRDGIVRVMLLDPLEQEAVRIAARQLDHSTDYPAADLDSALAATIGRVERMADWNTEGEFEYRYAAFNPGFSLVVIDPYGKESLLIVEFHGIHNESLASRMHLEMTRADSEHWFSYWRSQFEHLWISARRPEPA